MGSWIRETEGRLAWRWRFGWCYFWICLMELMEKIIEIKVSMPIKDWYWLHSPRFQEVYIGVYTGGLSDLFKVIQSSLQLSLGTCLKVHQMSCITICISIHHQLPHHWGVLAYNSHTKDPKVTPTRYNCGGRQRARDHHRTSGAGVDSSLPPPTPHNRPITLKWDTVTKRVNDRLRG